MKIEKESPAYVGKSTVTRGFWGFLGGSLGFGGKAGGGLARVANSDRLVRGTFAHSSFFGLKKFTFRSFRVFLGPAC